MFSRTTRAAVSLLLLAAMPTVASAQTFPPAMQRAATDTEGLDLSLKEGPAVWVEEHWDVKPGNLEQFLAAYDKEFYSLARQTPGYRGYTVLTTLPPLSGDARPSTGLGATPPFVRSHGAIRIKGGLRTNKLANWDALFINAFNVIIVHHIDTWADADKFRDRVAAQYAKQAKGETLGDRLALTLFPFANNFWWADYRLVNTSWQRFATAAPAKAGDADGLNLEPAKGAQVLVGEHWDVPEEKFCNWLEAYTRDVYQVIRRTPGYRGWSIATSLPPQPCEGKVAPITKAGMARLGGSDDMFVPAPGVLEDGIVRTDLSINVGAVYKKTFNVILVHQIDAWANSDAWKTRFDEIYARDNNGAQFVDLWAKNLMTFGNNHWDTYMRVVQSSFTPKKAD